LQQPGVTEPIIGASQMQHSEDAVAALELKLDDTELKALAEHIRARGSFVCGRGAPGTQFSSGSIRRL
jgi:aryl-alcohol dehydrogenase-like predicted oxidoreductase